MVVWCFYECFSLSGPVVAQKESRVKRDIDGHTSKKVFSKANCVFL